MCEVRRLCIIVLCLYLFSVKAQDDSLAGSFLSGKNKDLLI